MAIRTGNEEVWWLSTDRDGKELVTASQSHVDVWRLDRFAGNTLDMIDGAIQ
jgi:hypothetical protein